MSLDKFFNKINGLKVIIIGDVMLDSYSFGKIERNSPEAPVPIVDVIKKENRIGGAANVALNIKSLGGIPYLFSCIGEDNYGKIIFALIIGGAVGNLYDRLTYFAVPDFIDFHIKNFHWFTFNIADVFITFGIFFMLIKEFFFKQNS